MSEWGAGPAPRDPDRPEPDPRQPVAPEPDPRQADAPVPARPLPLPAPNADLRKRVRPKPAVPPNDADVAAPAGQDPVGVIAVGVGLLGIVVFGILCALVAGILGAIAGQRAREAGRSYELAYLAFILAGVDGVVWIALHYLFKLPIEVG